MRRRIGVMMLLVASALIAAWVRSWENFDVIVVPFVDGGCYILNSADQTLMISRRSTPAVAAWEAGKLSEMGLYYANGVRKRRDPFLNKDVGWRWDLGGISLATYQLKLFPKTQFLCCVIPYWSVAIPSIVASVWLFRSRPRGPNQAESPTRTINEGLLFLGAFFSGWRRKLGIVTLAMACLLMAEWIRSPVVRDVLMFGNCQFVSTSSRGIQWWRMEYNHPVVAQITWKSVTRQTTDTFPDNFFAGDLGTSVESLWRHRLCGFPFGTNRQDWRIAEAGLWRWQLAGFDLGRGKFRTQSFAASLDGDIDEAGIAYWLIPYWSLILPLTAISALLLWTSTNCQRSTGMTMLEHEPAR